MWVLCVLAVVALSEKAKQVFWWRPRGGYVWSDHTVCIAWPSVDAGKYGEIRLTVALGSWASTLRAVSGIQEFIAVLGTSPCCTGS